MLRTILDNAVFFIFIIPWQNRFFSTKRISYFRYPREKCDYVSSQILSASLYVIVRASDANTPGNRKSKIFFDKFQIQSPDLTVSITRVISPSKNIIHRIRRVPLRNFSSRHFRIPSRLELNENRKYVNICITVVLDRYDRFFERLN